MKFAQSVLSIKSGKRKKVKVEMEKMTFPNPEAFKKIMDTITLIQQILPKFEIRPLTLTQKAIVDGKEQVTKKEYIAILFERPKKEAEP